MKREKVISGNIYHVLSRGVDKRQIFMDDKDYLRFIHDLFEFNDTKLVNNLAYRFRRQLPYKVIATPYIEQTRTLLVEILAFCLMPNHYHLLIKPRFDDGITKFMKKLNIGYSRYFNEKYQRKGAFFEGRYKLVPVSNEAHFVHIPYYIHLNPLDLTAPEWRERKIENHQVALNFLENYRWSSYPDYIGKKNFPSVTSREFLNQIFGEPETHKKAVEDWLKNLEIQEIQNFTLE